MISLDNDTTMTQPVNATTIIGEEEKEEEESIARLDFFYKRSIEPLCIKRGFQSCKPIALVNHEHNESFPR